MYSVKLKPKLQNANPALTLMLTLTLTHGSKKNSIYLCLLLFHCTAQDLVRVDAPLRPSDRPPMVHQAVLKTIGLAALLQALELIL